MDYPLVSILVANFNNGRYIAQMLESAAGQTYPNIEIVIVDDGSTDHSLLVIENFMAAHPEQRIRLFKNNDNKGCGRIKSQCVESSKGGSFCFVDPDDAIVPDAVSALMDVFMRHPEFGLVYSTHFLCNEKLEPFSVSTYSGPIPQGQSHLTSQRGHISHLVLCNRSVYNKTLGINPTYLVAEDQDLYIKMEEMAPVYYVGKPLYYYRKHDSNSSWDEAKAFTNFYWKYTCEKAAYKRRRKCDYKIDNISTYEMDKKTFSFYLRLGKERWKKGDYGSACIAFLKLIPFSYVKIFH